MAYAEEPDVRDEVKHVREDVTGVVLAKYSGQQALDSGYLTFKPIVPSTNYLDVRLPNDHVYYCSPAENWVVTRPVEEIE